MRFADPFADRPSLRLRYRGEHLVLLAKRLAITCWLGILLVPLFAALDMILYPHLLLPLSLIRVVTVALTAAALLAVRTPRGHHRARALSLLVFWQIGLGIITLTYFTGGGSSPYYAGLSLTMLVAAVVMPFDSGLSAACNAVLICMYAGFCLAIAGVPDLKIFAGNLFFLLSTAVIVVVSHAWHTVARRREFLQRLALEESGRHRDEFLANITHELRTPLAAIIGFCEMLDDYMTDAKTEHRTWLARIRGNALTLYRLIVQLLDFSKIEVGAMQLTQERCTLDATVGKVGADMHAIAGTGGVEVDVQIMPGTPAVLGDLGRIEEIVTNLAINALKFSGGRPITLALAHGAIDRSPPWQRVVPEPDSQAASRTYVEVSVTDRGEGILSENLRHLFVAFRQLDGSSTRRQGGTGLGLAISARLAAAMQGHIAVRSVPGMGSTFALLLPAAALETERATDDITAGRAADAGLLTPFALEGAVHQPSESTSATVSSSSSPMSSMNCEGLPIAKPTPRS